MENGKAETFALPMNVMVLFYPAKSGGVVAHSLDFDLVCVAPTLDEAGKRMKFTIRRYVEYGIKNRFGSHIRRPAPSQYWDLIPDSAIPEKTETLFDRKIFATSYESKEVAL